MACLTRCKYCGETTVNHRDCPDCVGVVARMAEAGEPVDAEAVAKASREIKSERFKAAVRERLKWCEEMRRRPLPDFRIGVGITAPRGKAGD